MKYNNIKAQGNLFKHITCGALHKLIEIRQALWFVNDRLNIQVKGACINTMWTNFLPNTTLGYVPTHILAKEISMFCIKIYYPFELTKTGNFTNKFNTHNEQTWISLV